ncbi:MAG: Homoisocitrate dehydrogenase [Candidatus Argoarchaeum ethanivorans]|uniref:3-isopropylmalate dehydrogenase n=1 Tax=Candidatus Argoarchaeum ethanivorans TaxID=2608793 RepID=A0A811TF44_9EURY|nr:MAG: Homoisocitrate dehydrogenase [Candidatus Argoarchaeum ethanivorans]
MVHNLQSVALQIAVVEGDGIGREVIPEAVKIIKILEPDFELVPVEIGCGKWERTGTAVSKEDLDLMHECTCTLFGAVTTPPDPNYKSVLLQIRKEFDLYANIRPYKYYQIKNSPYQPAKPFEFVIVRENTEGLYSGIEQITKDEATTTRLLTRKGCERITEIACRIAAQKNTDITIAHKANVLKSDVFFRNIAAQTIVRHNIAYNEVYIDAMAYHLVLHPQNYHVIVTTNLFGDILSDLAAALMGGLGLCPSASISEGYALFEPVHGSAPDIAGCNIANPIAAILSTKMMCEWLGKHESAAIIQQAVEYAILHRIVTPDLGGVYTTTQVTEAIIKYIKNCTTKLCRR